MAGMVVALRIVSLMFSPFAELPGGTLRALGDDGGSRRKLRQGGCWPLFQVYLCILYLVLVLVKVCYLPCNQMIAARKRKSPMFYWFFSTFDEGESIANFALRGPDRSTPVRLGPDKGVAHQPGYVNARPRGKRAGAVLMGLSKSHKP
jgi:hypothetical protein